ncbi:MAG: AAA family ATPase, partial [Candidatus Aenigmarchaeota archaeon]|nr:AAA family ATPase [Candidatus Aenigmarchaeota archaeon]
NGCIQGRYKCILCSIRENAKGKGSSRRKIGTTGFFSIFIFAAGSILMLIIFSGLPATGKTTLARKVAEKTGAIILRTDVIRKEMFTEPKYIEEEKEQVYNEMFSRAEKFLIKGQVVILDANFYLQSLRDRAGDVARQSGKKFFIVECILDEEKVLERMKERPAKQDASDANSIEIYHRIKKLWEPIREPHIVIDASGEGALEEVLEKISKKS